MRQLALKSLFILSLSLTPCLVADFSNPTAIELSFTLSHKSPKIKQSLELIHLLFLETSYKEKDKALSQEWISKSQTKLQSLLEDSQLSEEDLYQALGSFIWSFDQNPKETTKSLEYAPEGQLLDLLAKKRVSLHQEFQKKLDEIKQKQEQAKLQDPILSRFTEHGVLLSSALIPKGGRLNLALLPDFIIKKEASSYPEPLVFAINQILHAIENDPSFVTKLQQTSAPAKENIKGSQVIRMQLRLSPNEPITETQSARAVLASQFGNLRQDGHVGSCFATSLGILMGKNFLHQELQDLQDIAKDGFLTRELKEGAEHFPFMFRMNEQELKKAKVKLALHTGRLRDHEPEIFLWELPCVAAMLHYLGAVDPQAFTLAAFEAVKSRKSSVYSLYDVVRVLSRYYQNEHKDDKVSEEQLTQELVMVYRSQTDHVLQRAWENILSAMAEGKEKSIFKKKAVKNTISALSIELSKQVRELGLESGQASAVKGDFQRNIRDVMVTRTKMKYDPTLAWESKSLDGSSANGAFVIYDAKDPLKPWSWERVDSEESFLAFMKDVINEALQKTSKELESNEDKSAVAKVAPLLIAYLQENSFMQNIEKRYGNSGKEHFKKIPWIARNGHHPNSVLDVYLGRKGKYVRTSPDDPHGLYDSVVKLSEQYGKGFKQEFLDNPDYLMPMTSPHHAFTTMMGKYDLSERWKTNKDFNRFKTESLLFVGMDYAKKTLPEDRREKIVESISEKLPSSIRSRFISQAADIDKAASFREFYNKSYSIVSGLSKNTKLLDKLSVYVDNAFFKHLRQEELSQYPVLFFADTNWNMGPHDSYFAFTVSLSTGELIVASVSEDKSRFFVQNQKGSFFVKPGWELFKANPLL